jgi:hypothetical protein
MIRGKDTYDVFVRDWWRRPDHYDPDLNPNARVPYPGAPRRYIARGVSETEARELCQEYAATHSPGWRSRKAEYESAS